MKDPEHPYVGRGGLKLEHALRIFGVNPTACRCADFGCHVGGFTDCLLRHGAATVYAVDTAYGTLDYRLRTDDRVIVMERTNAMHATPPDEPVHLVVGDVGWTPLKRWAPIALEWLHCRPEGRIIALIKPHYEVARATKGRSRPILAPEEAEAACADAIESASEFGAVTLGVTRSPILGGATRGVQGNIEFLALLAPASSDQRSADA